MCKVIPFSDEKNKNLRVLKFFLPKFAQLVSIRAEADIQTSLALKHKFFPLTLLSPETSLVVTL